VCLRRGLGRKRRRTASGAVRILVRNPASPLRLLDVGLIGQADAPSAMGIQANDYSNNGEGWCDPYMVGVPVGQEEFWVSTQVTGVEGRYCTYKLER
jgi:hypothetical protein